MNRDDLTLTFGLLLIFVVLPIVAMAVSEWQKKECRIEMAKIQMPINDIERVCK